MEVERQSSDRISALPQDTIEKILSSMPMRDAIRTSILSKKWRYGWTRMPKLVFDYNLVEVSYNSDGEEINKHKIVIAILHVLLLHRGPISELRIRSGSTELVKEMDMIILHLSWSKNIKKFIFGCAEGYKLPCSFFSLQGLEHLSLDYCKFELPLMFNGFSKLKSLEFYHVEITAKMLQRFLTNCPLLEEVTLIISADIMDLGEFRCTCLPSVQVLKISNSYIKHFAAGGTPQQLPTSLVHLRILVLDDVCFHKPDEFSSTLRVINSSPNLEKIQMKIALYLGRTLTNLLDPQDYSGLKLDHLKELEITSFHNHNYGPQMEFVKLIMAKSPVLKKARIELDISVSVEKENKMLRDFLLLPFPRASPTAKFSIERRKRYR